MRGVSIGHLLAQLGHGTRKALGRFTIGIRGPLVEQGQLVQQRRIHRRQFAAFRCIDLGEAFAERIQHRHHVRVSGGSAVIGCAFCGHLGWGGLFGFKHRQLGHGFVRRQEFVFHARGCDGVLRLEFRHLRHGGVFALLFSGEQGLVDRLRLGGLGDRRQLLERRRVRRSAFLSRRICILVVQGRQFEGHRIERLGRRGGCQAVRFLVAILFIDIDQGQADGIERVEGPRMAFAPFRHHAGPDVTYDEIAHHQGQCVVGLRQKRHAFAGAPGVLIGLEDAARLREHGYGFSPAFTDRDLRSRHQLIHAFIGPQLLSRAHLGFGDLPVETSKRRQDLLGGLFVLEAAVALVLRGSAAGRQEGLALFRRDGPKFLCFVLVLCARL